MYLRSLWIPMEQGIARFARVGGTVIDMFLPSNAIARSKSTTLVSSDVRCTSLPHLLCLKRMIPSNSSKAKKEERRSQSTTEKPMHLVCKALSSFAWGVSIFNKCWILTFSTHSTPFDVFRLSNTPL